MAIVRAWSAWGADEAVVPVLRWLRAAAHLRVGGDEIADFLRRALVGDVEHPQPRVEVGEEHEVLVLP